MKNLETREVRSHNKVR